MQFGHVENLNAFDWIDDVFRVGRQFSDALLKVEHFLGEFRRLQTGGAQQLYGVFQKHLVSVDGLHVE